MNTIQQQEKTFRVLTGKTVVITGGTSGVGRAAAAAFALEGCNGSVPKLVFKQKCFVV